MLKPRLRAALMGNLVFGWWKMAYLKSVGLYPVSSSSALAAPLTCLKYAGTPVNLLPCLGYISLLRLQKSGVSVT